VGAPAAPPDEDEDTAPADGTPDDEVAGEPDETPGEPADEDDPPARRRRLSGLRSPFPDRVFLILTWLVVAAGIGLRLRQWWYGRAFWLDELLLIKAMSEQRITEVLRPLGLDQSAPPGWLLVEHALIAHAPGERGARLLPLVFGVGSLVVTALLARVLLGSLGALAATALAALSTQLITYSAELKQYSADAFWMQLVLLLGARLALRRGHPARDRYVLAAVAAVAVWFSHAAAIATGGVFLALALQALATRRRRELAVLVGCAVPFAAGLGVEYETLLKANTANPVLKTFWASTFPPEGPLTWSIGWDWFTERTRSVVLNPLYWDYRVALLALILGGLVVIGIRTRWGLAVFLLPVAAVVAAGLVGAYPIANRLALWVIPLAGIAVAAPLDLIQLAARIPRPRVERWAGVAVAAVLVVLAGGQLVTMSRDAVDSDRAFLVHPREQEESRTALAAVAHQLQPGDLVLVDWGGTRFAAQYYAPKVGISSYRLLRANRVNSQCPPVWFGSTLRHARSIKRVWLVYVHTGARLEVMYEDHLSQFGPVAERIPVTGGGALRFDRSASTPAPPEARIQRCLTLEAPGDSTT
jgi:hypothetical protein